MRNGFEPTDKALLKRVVRRVIRSIPAKVRAQCSYRLVRRGLYMSINAGNHLVFRAPGYSDAGRREDDDLWLIWPQATPISVLSRREWKWATAYRFDAIPCCNIGLSFEQALSLQPDEWRTFGRACHDALFVRRTRRWVSNVRLPKTGVT